MADDQAPHDWQLLSRTCYSLGRPDHPQYRALCHDYYPREHLYLAIERALRTGDIPIRGQRVTAFGLGPPERIEGKLDAEAAIDIPLDEITLRLVATDFTPEPRRPIRRPRIWKPSKEWVKREKELFESVLAERKLRAEKQFSGLSMIAPSAAGAPRAKKRDHSPPCLEVAKFRLVEADMARVEQCLRENILRADHVVDEPTVASDEAQDDVGGVETAPETSAPKPRARPQRSKAKHLLQNMFPNGMPPKDELPPGALLAKCKGPEWEGLKRDSIGRAAKELREAAAWK